VAKLNPRNVRFGLRDTALVLAWDLSNIQKQFRWILGFIPWYQCGCWFTKGIGKATLDQSPLFFFFNFVMQQ
jgi:hypothetical protein